MLPLYSDSNLAPCVMTVIIMTSILINANVDAFANYSVSACSLSNRGADSLTFAISR